MGKKKSLLRRVRPEGIIEQSFPCCFSNYANKKNIYTIEHFLENKNGK